MLRVLLHDDWEINGDGTGDPNELMFDPIRSVLDICDCYGARYTIFAEVMQQFAMLDSDVPEHRAFAAKWEIILRDAVRRGHDVQLHLHPQWIGARFVKGRWCLDSSKWNISHLSENTIYKLLSRGKDYLEKVLQPLNERYRVVAFRAGGWMAQPSGELIRGLRRAGIRADCSAVPGKHVRYQEFGEIDYRQVPNRLLPWWTNAEDVARLGRSKSGVLEIPSYAEEFHMPLPLFLLANEIGAVRHYWKIYRSKMRKKGIREYSPRRIRSNEERIGPVGRFFAKRSTYCSFGYMHYRTILKMVRNARMYAARQGVLDSPLVMLTHSKSFFSIENFDSLLKELSGDPEVRFSTTQECVERLATGEVEGLPLEMNGTKVACAQGE